eukprot:scaffold51422_cov16-Tisochrysis_lutea.AAC.1
MATAFAVLLLGSLKLILGPGTFTGGVAVTGVECSLLSPRPSLLLNGYRALALGTLFIRTTNIASGRLGVSLCLSGKPRGKICLGESSLLSVQLQVLQSKTICAAYIHGGTEPLNPRTGCKKHVINFHHGPVDWYQAEEYQRQGAGSKTFKDWNFFCMISTAQPRTLMSSLCSSTTSAAVPPPGQGTDLMSICAGSNARDPSMLIRAKHGRKDSLLAGRRMGKEGPLLLYHRLCSTSFSKGNMKGAKGARGLHAAHALNELGW